MAKRGQTVRLQQIIAGSKKYLLNRILVGAARFASNIPTIHLVGLSASGYNEGLVRGNFEWMAAVTLFMIVTTGESSIVNPAFVIKIRGRHNADKIEIKINRQTISDKKAVYKGKEADTDGKSMPDILLKYSTEKTVYLELKTN